MTSCRCRWCDRRRAHRFTYAQDVTCPRCGRGDAIEQLGPCGRVSRIAKPRPKRSRKSPQSHKPGRVIPYWTRLERNASSKGD